MAYTKLADMLVPEVWSQYVIERTAELSEVWQSGIISDVNAQVSVPNGGTQVEMPFFQDLSGDDDVLDDTENLAVNKVDTEQDRAVVLRRAKVFGASDLSGDVAGSDPMAMIGDRFAAYWARQMQKALISTLNGAVPAVTDNVLNISALSGAASDFDGESFIDAQALLGDHQDMLAAVAVHSGTYTSMKKQDLIDFIPDSEGKPTIPTYMGKRVIVDDGMPKTSAGVYTTYLFAPGAIGYAEGSPKVPAETDREALTNGGSEYIVNRRYFILHPRGIRWEPGSGVPAKQSPSNTELAGSNWEQAYESKNIRIVQFRHTLAS